MNQYDIIIIGGGIAGLFIANRLQRAGYNFILIEKDQLGDGQTLASQGMIHGGQKYALQGKQTQHSQSSAAMPARWDACLSGTGDVDLTDVQCLSQSQLMFPAGGQLSPLSVFAAAWAVRGHVQRLEKIPEALMQRHPVYDMDEKVMETKSLITALANNIKDHIFRGEVQELLPDGQIAVSGLALRAQMIIFTAGTGNEDAIKLLKVKEQHTQRRPLRQIMVRTMNDALYGHGIISSPKPRVTITSHPVGDNEYVWYLGGNIAEKSVHMTEDQALLFARDEMKDIFPHIDWDEKEWASWLVDRAEPFNTTGNLPPGPSIQQRGKTLTAWPTKMTFVPQLADLILERLEQSDIKPHYHGTAPALPKASIGLYPWEKAVWQYL